MAATSVIVPLIGVYLSKILKVLYLAFLVYLLFLAR